MRNLLEMRGSVQHASGSRQVASLEADASAQRTVELERARMEMLQRLALAAEFRDDRTGRNTPERVGRTARDASPSSWGCPTRTASRSGSPRRCTTSARSDPRRHPAEAGPLRRGARRHAAPPAARRRDPGGSGSGCCARPRDRAATTSAGTAAATRAACAARRFPRRPDRRGRRRLRRADARPAVQAPRVERGPGGHDDRRGSGVPLDPQVVDAFTTLEHPVLL